MRLFKLLSKITLALLTLNLASCGGVKPNITVDDIVVGGYEGPAGGPVACSEVHTLFTDVPPAHYDLNTCLARLVGKVYLDGAPLNKMVANIDTMCTSLGSCTYEQEQAARSIKSALVQILKVLPRKRHQ